jgi:hypothetical protein
VATVWLAPGESKNGRIEDASFFGSQDEAFDSSILRFP